MEDEKFDRWRFGEFGRIEGFGGIVEAEAVLAAGAVDVSRRMSRAAVCKGRVERFIEMAESERLTIADTIMTSRMCS